MKKLLLLTVILGLMFSCSNDEVCTTEAYKIEVSSTTTQPTIQSRVVNPSDLTLTADMNVDGDLDVKNLKLKGFMLSVTGNLDVSKDIKVEGGVLVVNGSITVTKNLHLNDGSVTANEILIIHDLNGHGTITYCESLIVEHHTHHDPIIIQDCGDVLSDNSINYQIVDVACELIGTTQDGYKYIAK